jgi:Glutathione S-transferase, C-terminal domain
VDRAFSKAKSAPEDPACPGVSGAAKFVAEELPGLLAKLSAVAELTGTPGYAVGNKMSLAGLRLYLLATDGMVPSGGVAEVAAAFAAQPRLQAIIDNVAANEKLKAWLAKRPVTPF